LEIESSKNPGTTRVEYIPYKNPAPLAPIKHLVEPCVFLTCHRRRQSKAKPPDLHLRVKKHRRGSLVLPHPSPWTEVHRSEPPPASSLKKRGSASCEQVANSLRPMNPR
jgi:hypothetical protein